MAFDRTPPCPLWPCSPVRSTDSRIIPELLTKTLKPLARTEVVTHLHLESSACAVCIIVWRCRELEDSADFSAAKVRVYYDPAKAQP